jgi:hypothetical protein
MPVNNGPQNTPLSSAGLVAQAQQARDDGAAVQFPNEPPVTLSATERFSSPLNRQFGTDAPVRTLAQTQSTPPNSVTRVGTDVTRALPGGGDPISNTFPITNDSAKKVQDDAAAATKKIVDELAGRGAPGDDASLKNQTQATIDTIFDNTIVAQPNILDKYSSYNYVASFYLMSKDDMQKMVNSRNTDISGAQLLFQSGGAPQVSPVGAPGRNPYFNVDYYIDHIKIKSQLTGRATGTANNSTELEMTVIEPYGITLVPNLVKAIEQYIGAGSSSLGSQVYLLVVRFYGYDEQGNLVRCGNKIGNGSDVNAFIEKFFPLQITKLDFKVANKLVEYHMEFAVMAYNVAAGSARNSLLTNIELSGQTVKEVLDGAMVPAQATSGQRDNQTANQAGTRAPLAPEKATASTNPKGTYRPGLIATLNRYQEELVKKGTYLYPDRYIIEFSTPAIANAKILVKGGDNKGTGMQMTESAADKTVPDKQSVDPTSRLTSFTAGQQITQIIDQTIRNSTYITDQSNTLVAEKTGELSVNPSEGKNTAWYKINMQAVPRIYDGNRNDYAYDIKFLITPYQIADMKSSYFNSPKITGVHKRYDYWFTGQNTQVLNYEQTYDLQYYLSMTGDSGSTGSLNDNTDIKQVYSPRSGQSGQGAAGKTNEIAANAADYLYSKSALAEASLSIIGDPAWLQQGELLALPRPEDVSYGPFLADGTLNFDSSQILFEIAINAPQDYNMQTGLMDPNTRMDGSVIRTTAKNEARRRYVYKANEIESEFVKGKFTQMLKGTLVQELTEQRFSDTLAQEREALSNLIPTTRDRNVNTDRAKNTENNVKKPQAVKPTTSGSTNNNPNPTPVQGPPPKPATSNGAVNPAAGRIAPDDIFVATTDSNVNQYINREA